MHNHVHFSPLLLNMAERVGLEPFYLLDYSNYLLIRQIRHPTFHPEPQHSPVSLVGAGTAVAQLGYGNCTAFWVWC